MPMNQHPLDDLAAYSLGALEPQEVQDLEAHLASCTACSAELLEYQALAATLTAERLVLDPPGAGWESLAARLPTASPQSAVLGNRPPLLKMLPRAIVSTRAILLGWAATAAALAVLLGIVLWRDSPPATGEGADVSSLARAEDGTVVPLAAAGGSPSLSGRLYVSADQTQGGLAAVGLPQLPAGSTYQIWFVRPDQSRASGGLFVADQRGAALVKVTIPGPLSEFAGVGITGEPAGGSATPTSQDVLAGPLYER